MAERIELVMERDWRSLKPNCCAFFPQKFYPNLSTWLFSFFLHYIGVVVNGANALTTPSDRLRLQHLSRTTAKVDAAPACAFCRTSLPTPTAVAKYRVFATVVSVCLIFRMISQKPTHKCFTMSPFILGSIGQRSCPRATKTVPAWVVALVWELASSSLRLVVTCAALPSVPSHDPVSSSGKPGNPGSATAMSCDVSRTSSSIMSVESMPPDGERRIPAQRQYETLAS